MPSFISDDDMAKLDASQPKPSVISDQDMAALEAYHQRPGFIDKIKSIPGSIIQAGKTLINAPDEFHKGANPLEAADVAARGLASGASWLTIPEGVKLEGEKAIARNLPQALGGISDEDYQNLYGNRSNEDLENQNAISEARSRAKFPAVDLASRAAGFSAGLNPAAMIAKTGTQSVSNALNQGDSIPRALLEGGEDSLIQGGLTYGPQAITKIPDAMNYASNKLGSLSEKLAENATGATGLQASKFRPGAGRELLDRGIVSFGDSPANIAEKSGAANAAAKATIDDALKSLDDRGVTVSVDNIVDEINKRIDKMKSDPAQSSVVRQLRNEIDNITETSSSEVPISAAEKTKRGYQDKVNWVTPDSNPSNAAVSNVYKNAVENTAEAADPQIADKFKTAKDTYGLLAPIEEAASRRASTLAQHPTGGLGDMVAAGVGGAPGVIAKKALFPRTSSALAVTGDWLSKKLAGGGQTLGKYAQPLQAAAARGGNALGVTHYLLQSIDPEYQKMMQEESTGNQ